jgi:hypothetical protein
LFIQKKKRKYTSEIFLASFAGSSAKEAVPRFSARLPACQPVSLLRWQAGALSDRWEEQCCLVYKTKKEDKTFQKFICQKTKK